MVKDTFYALVVRVFGAFTAFIFSLVIANKLGAEESGYFFLTFSIITLLSALVRLGLDDVILRYSSRLFVVQELGEIRAIMRVALSRILLSALLVSAIIFVFARFISFTIFSKEELFPLLRIMSFTVVAISLSALVAMALQGMRRIAYSVFLLNIGIGLIVSVLVVLIDLRNYLEIGWVFLGASYSVLFLGLVFFFRFSNCGTCSKATKRKEKYWPELWENAAPLWMVMFMDQMILWAGQIISGVWVSSSDVALLAIAQRTALLTSFVLMAVNLVVAPRFSSLHHNKNTETLNNTVYFSLLLSVVLAIPIAVALLFFPEFILSFFGEEFIQSKDLLRILVLGQMVNVATGSVGYLLTMTGHMKDMRNVMYIVGSLSIGLLLLLVPLFGVYGSAIATSVGLVIQNLLAVWFVNKRLGLNLLNLNMILRSRYFFLEYNNGRFKND